jgi:hypothetical protein
MDRITHQSPRQQGYGSTSSLRNDSLKHTRKHERRGKESNQRTTLSASGGLSGQVPRRPGGPSVRVPDRPLLKLGPSANQLQRKPKTKLDRKQRCARTRRTRDEHAARGPFATSPRTVRAARTEQKTARPRGSTLPIHHRISQTVEAVETRVWGQVKRQTRMLYPKNFAS